MFSPNEAHVKFFFFKNYFLVFLKCSEFENSCNIFMQTIQENY